MKKLITAFFVLGSLSAFAQGHLSSRINCEIEGSSPLKVAKFSANYQVNRSNGEVVNSQIRKDHQFLIKSIKLPSLADGFIASGLTGHNPSVRLQFNELSDEEVTHLLSLMGGKGITAVKGLKMKAMYFWDYNGEGSGRYGITGGELDSHIYKIKADDGEHEVKLTCQSETLN